MLINGTDFFTWKTQFSFIKSGVVYFIMDNPIGDFPVMQTDRLLLRQFSFTDLEYVFRGLSDPDVIKYYGVHFNSLEETKQQLDWFNELEKNRTGIWWAMTSLDDSKFYGAVGLYYLKREHNKAEIGFWLLPEYWGLGMIGEIMPLVIDYGFNKMQLHRIEGFVEPENLNSKKLMKRIGFTYEGTMKDCEIKNGKYISLDIFVKLNPKEILNQTSA